MYLIHLHDNSLSWLGASTSIRKHAMVKCTFSSVYCTQLFIWLLLEIVHINIAMLNVYLFDLYTRRKIFPY